MTSFRTEGVGLESLFLNSVIITLIWDCHLLQEVSSSAEGLNLLAKDIVVAGVSDDR